VLKSVLIHCTKITVLAYKEQALYERGWK